MCLWPLISPDAGFSNEDQLKRGAWRSAFPIYVAWLWEIENASQHPEQIAAALLELRRRHPAVAAAQ